MTACVITAGGASAANASINAYAEPQYTKATSNTWWWDWTAEWGYNYQGGYDYRYYLCQTAGVNGQQTLENQGANGPGAYGCTNLVRSNTGGANSGRVNYTFPGVATNADGARYDFCLDGRLLNDVAWVVDNANVGHCQGTIIDRNKPSITVSVDGTTEVTNNPSLSLAIAYSDATSPPWQGAGGKASNWTCVTLGQACTPGASYDPNCSILTGGTSRQQTFTCAASVAGQPDGRWYFCAKSADTAVPDNPSGPNQFQYATSDNANISDVACGYVNVDRAGPTVTANASATSVQTGQLVSFSGAASDPHGVSGQYDWDFGDNTGHGSGVNTTHTYTQPGTYQVKAKSTDSLGNAGTGTVTITVTAPPSGGGTGGNTGGNTGGGTGGNTGGGTGGNTGGNTGGGTGGNTGGGTGGNTGGNTGGGTGGNTGGGTGGQTGGGTGGQTGGNTGGQSGGNGGGSGSNTGVTPVSTPITMGEVSNNAGGGGAQNVVVGGLKVVAPKKINAGKVRQILLALTPNNAGKAQVALLKGKKVVAQKGATFGTAGTYALKVKLPKKLASGKYTIRVTFTATGAKKPVTKTVKVTVTAAKKAHRKPIADEGPLKGRALAGHPAH